MHLQYTDFSEVVKLKFSVEKKNDIFLSFVINIDCGHTLELPCRGGSNEYHNLCFGAKIRKIGTCIPI